MNERHYENAELDNFYITDGIFMGVQGWARGRGHTMTGAAQHIGMLGAHTSGHSCHVPYTHAAASSWMRFSNCLEIKQMFQWQVASEIS